MGSEQIQSILDAISELKKELAELKNKRLNIEDIGIGSFVGWLKLTVTVVLFFSVLVGSAYGILSQVNSLDSQYHSHMKYLHNQVAKSESNGS